jgi:hypothetical protein
MNKQARFNSYLERGLDRGCTLRLKGHFSPRSTATTLQIGYQFIVGLGLGLPNWDTKKCDCALESRPKNEVKLRLMHARTFVLLLAVITVTCLAAPAFPMVIDPPRKRSGRFAKPLEMFPM